MAPNPTLTDWHRAVQALAARIETATCNAAPNVARSVQGRLAHAIGLAKRGHAVEAYASILNA